MMTLKQYLDSNSLTQSQFADRVGVKQATISRLNGRSPGLDLARKISEATEGDVPVFSWPAFADLHPTQEGAV